MKRLAGGGMVRSLTFFLAVMSILPFRFTRYKYITERSAYCVKNGWRGDIGYFVTLLTHFLPCLSWKADLYREYQSDPLAFWIPIRFSRWED